MKQHLVDIFSFKTIRWFLRKYKRYIIRFTYLVSFLACICFQIFMSYEIRLKNDHEKRLQSFMVIGHKGGSTKYAENTMPAFQAAMMEDWDMIELDVQLTKDKQVVVCHDTNIKRMTGIDRYVYDMTLSELKSIPILEEYSGEKNLTMPTLDEVVAYAKGKKALMIELKPVNGNDHILAKEVVRILQKYDVTKINKVQCFQYNAIEYVKKYDSSITCGLCISHLQGDISAYQAIDFFSLQGQYLKESTVKMAHMVHKDIYVWTIDREEEIEKMIKLNIDGMISNHPQDVYKMKQEELRKMKESH